MYKVIKHFHDLQDDCHEYNVGDVYPREGPEPSAARVEQLSGSHNAQGVPLILLESDPAPAKKRSRKG